MTLIEKLTKAGLSVGGKLKADKRNQEQQYNYISADKILSVCGQALFEQGVIVLPEADTQTIETITYTNRYGKEQTRYDATVDFIMTITDGETDMQAKWSGAGNDYSAPDKALYKAITSGHKYFLMKLLNVGEGNEDGEHDPADQPTEDSKPAKQPAKQTAQKQPAKSNGNGTPANPPEMTLETAVAVTNSNGAKYGTLDNDTLAHMATALQKHVDEGTATDDHRYKLSAARTILEARNK